jgi:hypothetical protein
MADAGREALTPMPPCILSVDVIGDGEDEAAFNAEPAVEPAAERGEAEEDPFADVATSTVLEDGRLTLERREEERQAEADAEAEREATEAASDAATASTILEDGPRPHPAEQWHYHLVSGDVSHNMSVSGNVDHAFAAGPEEAALEAEPEATEEEVAAEAVPTEATEEEAAEAASAEATEEAAAQPVHSYDWWEDSPAVPPQATEASDNPVALLAEQEEEEEESDEEDEEEEEEYVD